MKPYFHIMTAPPRNVNTRPDGVNAWFLFTADADWNLSKNNLI